MFVKGAKKRTKNFINLIKDFMEDFSGPNKPLELNNEAYIGYDDGGNMVFVIHFYLDGKDPEDFDEPTVIHQFK